MITLITGAPGAGKSAALVSLLSELGKDRAIYCSGIPELKLDHIDLDKLALDTYPKDDPVRNAYMAQSGNKDPSGPHFWPDLVPDGSIVVIDEVQRVWRPRGPGAKVPLDIAALETHRHRGLDFYIISQGPSLVDRNVRALIGRHVHLRDIGLLGRWWYEWPEVAESCSSSWKQAPIKKRYRLPKKIFGQYKSASVHIKPVRSVPMVVFVLALAVLGVAYLAWLSYSTINKKMTAPGVPSASGVVATASNPLGLKSMDNSPTAPAVELVAYDPAAFIPRVSSRPESAPLYDHLRTVSTMPMVSGAICMGIRCKCVTQQGTDAGLSPAECRQWMAQTPFNPYVTPVATGGTQRAPPVNVAPPNATSLATN